MNNKPMRKVVGLLSLFCLFFISLEINAQASLVPAQHQVYDWLHKQRIMGNIRFYSFETLPLNRGQIHTLLREIETGAKLNRIDQSQLRTYLLEFSMDTLRAQKHNTLLQGNGGSLKNTWNMKWRLLKSKQEPHLFIYEDSSAVVNLDYYYGIGLVDPDEGGEKDWTRYKITGLRTYGTIYKHLGFFLEAVNLSANEEGNSLRRVDYWGNTFDALNEKTSTVYAEGFVSAQYGKLGLHLGNGNIKYGVGNDESVIFRLKAANFDWVRLNYDSKFFNYTFLHGALQGETFIEEDPANPGVRSRTSVPRWISMRRLQIRPFKWAQFSFTETLTYSNRGIDLAYINPIYPLRIAEYDKQDQDNPTWYLDGVLKPFKGLEMYGTLGIDDLLKLSDVFKPTGSRSSEDAVVLYQAGIHFVPRGLFHLNAEYLRIDPFYYTHRFQNNAYVTPMRHLIPLAHNIGPNADQVYLSIKKWLPMRGWIKGYIAQVRKGLNILDDEGNVVLDAGGDLSMGQNGGTDLVRFLAGDVHKYRIVGIETYIEPWRGVGLFINYQRRMVTQGNRIQDLDQFGFRATVNFYPITRVLAGILPSSFPIRGWL